MNKLMTEIFSYDKKSTDPFNENLIIQRWNEKKPWCKIKQANLLEPYLIYDAVNKKGDKFEIKSISDSYQNGQFDTVLFPVSKIGCFGSLTAIYQFYDSIYYIKYSHNQFKNYIIKFLFQNGKWRRYFEILKRDMKFLCFN